MPFEIIVLFIASLFLFAFFAQEVGLPPLVGFLISGFVISGIEKFSILQDLFFFYPHQQYFLNHTLELLSQFGVLLMLFSIGLKLDIASFLKKEFWLTTSLQTLLMAIASCLVIPLAAWLNIPVLSELTIREQAILGFALSFSSTVLVIKILLERGELNGLAGKISTSILVLQDVLAVAYLALSDSEQKHALSVYTALLIPFLFLAKPFFGWVVNRLGHNEMLVLGGVFLALVPGALLFEHFGLHAELGALGIGVLLASHERAAEISKILFPLKEMLLTCYFLKLGIQGIPSVQSCWVAILLLLFLIIKNLGFLAFFRLFGFRIRTCVLSAFYLTNFSEFGLIVAAVSEKNGLLKEGWTSILVITTALSFLLVKPLEKSLPFWEKFLRKYASEETNERLNPSDRLISLGNAQILILGMGRVGTGAYDALVSQYGEIVLGVDLIESKHQKHLAEERTVVLADATDPDFWNRISAEQNLDLILLTMSNLQTNSSALAHLKAHQFKGRVAAIVDHEDERMILKEEGADAVFNVYSEAGSGFANHLIETLNLDVLFPEPENYLTPEDEDEEEKDEPES